MAVILIFFELQIRITVSTTAFPLMVNNKASRPGGPKPIPRPSPAAGPQLVQLFIKFAPFLTYSPLLPFLIPAALCASPLAWAGFSYFP
jgi:hypothetical protein